MKKIIVSGILTLSTIANSAPAEVYDGRTVVNTTTSPVLRDNAERTSRLHVLPPSSGKISKQTLNLFVSRTQCENLADIESDFREVRKQIREIRNQQHNLNMVMADDKSVSAAEKMQMLDIFKANAAAIKEFEVDMQKTYEKYASKQGGYIELMYSSGHGENVAKIKSDNPGFNNVTALYGQNMQINMVIPALTTEDSAGPIYLGYSVNGIDSKDLNNKVSLSTTSELTTLMTLTTLGACYFKYPMLFGSDVKPIFGLTTTYDIPRSFSFNVTASYNLWSVYSYLNEQGSSGGLFSSSSWSKTVESNWGDSTFSIDWNSEDPNDQTPLSERLRVQNEIKAQLLADLGSLISQKINVDVVAAGKPGANGASVIADDLTKIPDPYAQGAAIVLRGLNAIFGSSSSTVSYQKTLNVTSSHRFSSNTARFVKYTTVYTEN